MIEFIIGMIAGGLCATVLWAGRVKYYKTLCTEAIKAGKEAVESWQQERNEWDNTRSQILEETEHLNNLLIRKFVKRNS